MTEFITTEALKSNTYISSNFQEKNLQVAINEATRSLRNVVGDNLYEALCEKIDGSTLTGKYKILKEDYLDFYLYWRATYELQFGNTLKTTQTGTVRTTDLSVESTALEELKYLSNSYLNKCNEYILASTNYIKNNISYFPEYQTEGSFQQKPINNYNCPVQLDRFTKKCSYK